LLLLLCAAAGASGGRVALLIKGETFKVNSHQHGRETGAAGLASQRLAALSLQLFAVQPLLWDAGYERVDVFLDTYARSDGLDAQLSRWFSPTEGNSLKVTLHPPGDERHSFDLRGSKTEADQGVLAPDSPYEAALFLRPDLLLKPLFGAALAAANRSKLLFSFREWKNQDSYTQAPGVPRVADMVMWAPRWAFAMVRDDPAGFINNHVRPSLRCAPGNHSLKALAGRGVGGLLQRPRTGRHKPLRLGRILPAAHGAVRRGPGQVRQPHLRAGAAAGAARRAAGGARRAAADAAAGAAGRCLARAAGV